MKTKYIYILSQRYSGSTLLSFLLGSHPEISTIGERRKFYVNSIAGGGRSLKCSCGRPFQDCEHWNKIKSALLASVDQDQILHNPTEFQLFKNKYLDRLAYEYLLLLKRHELPIFPLAKRVAKQCDFNQKLVEEILRVDQKPAFLDSSKSNHQLLFLSQIDQFDIHVIWLSRDPRAQVHSALKYNKWTVEKAANLWKKEMDANARILKRLKLNYTELSYEVLCKNPEGEMRRVLKNNGLDPNSFSLDFRSQEQHIMGNYAMRLGNENKIEVRNEWSDGLTAEQVSTINRITTNYSPQHK